MSSEAVTRVPGVTVVKSRSARREGLFGFLTLLLAVGLVVGLEAAASTRTRILVIAVFGVILIEVAMMWWVLRQRAGLIEVSDDEVRYVSTSRRPSEVLVRRDGATLTFEGRASYRGSTHWLTQSGTEHRLPLPFFSRGAVQKALRQHGWRVS